MGLPIKVETRTGDTPVSRRQRQRRYPPDILLTTPEQLALLLSSDDAPFLFSLAEAHRARRIACAGHLQARRSAVARAGAAVAAGAGDARDRPVGDGRRAGIAGAVSGAAARRQAKSADIVVAGGAAAPIVEMLDTKERLPWAGHTARHALGEIYELIKAQQDHAGVRQHPQPGRNAVPGFLAHERRRPCDRAASRLARRRPAPQGRGRDGGRQTARRGLHLLARSRHRLGRHRSRHQCRRAQGRLAADAADRPRQPPPRRSLARRAGAGQPLRGAGMPRSRSMRSRRMRRTRRRCAPARSTCWRSTCSAAPAASRFCPTSSMRKC